MTKPVLTWLGRMVTPSILAACAVPLIELAFGRQLTPARLFTEFWTSLIYAFTIGALLTLAAPYVWVRSCQWPLSARWLARILTIVAGTAIGCLLSGLCLLVIFKGDYGFWPSFQSAFKIGLVISSFAVAFLVMFDTFQNRLRVSQTQLKAKELERERALKLATEARLASLESRIHPHFLFNTINSVSSLIHDDPKRAERMLSQMAGLLRFSLDAATAGLVPLEKEIKIVEDYLEIEKARFGPRLTYRLDLPPDLRSAPVPPLAIQTLVENSVKYAVSARRSGAAIQVLATRQAGRLHIQVTDDGPGFQALEIPSGHGLHNLEERLAALFGDNGRLFIASTPAGSSVTIEIPLQHVKAA